MLENYSYLKNKVSGLAEQVKESGSIEQDVLEKSRFSSQLDNLLKGDFKIALIAPFSAGKSTFINSLIGNDILSMEITAETSVITRVRYAEDMKIEIKFNDEREDEIIDCADNNEKLTDDYIKNIIEQKTTVKGENTEDLVKEVIIHYPIEMCKDNVEIVDTPGLFSRHEKHEQITNAILPNVNAVIFMIEPDNVGDEHFTKIIQNYVRNAKSSNLDKQGNHIFFVINKIDVFTDREIEKAKDELRFVLNDIIDRPQIFEVSSYYAMKGKMFFSEKIELIDLQLDHKIMVPDPEDPRFSISGRQLTEESVKNVMGKSKVKILEKGLGNYLEKKNFHLIEDLLKTIEEIITRSISKQLFEKESLENIYNIDSKNYNNKIDKLTQDIDNIKYQDKFNLEAKINKKFKGGSDRKGIKDDIQKEVRFGLEKTYMSINKKVRQYWKENKASVYEYNAKNKFEEIKKLILEEVTIEAKELTKNCFNKLEEETLNIVEDIKECIDRVVRNIEKTENEAIGRISINIDSLDIEPVKNEVMTLIGEEFSHVVTETAIGIVQELDDAKEKSTNIVEKRGFFYKIKSFFTGKEYEKSFDERAYKAALDEMLYEMLDELEGKILDKTNEITSPINKASQQLHKNLKEICYNILENIVEIKKRTLQNTKKEMNTNLNEKEKLIIDKQQRMEKNKKLLDQFQEVKFDMEDPLGECAITNIMESEE